MPLSEGFCTIEKLRCIEIVLLYIPHKNEVEKLGVRYSIEVSFLQLLFLVNSRWD